MLRKYWIEVVSNAPAFPMFRKIRRSCFYLLCVFQWFYGSWRCLLVVSERSALQSAVKEHCLAAGF